MQPASSEPPKLTGWSKVFSDIEHELKLYDVKPYPCLRSRIVRIGLGTKMSGAFFSLLSQGTQIVVTGVAVCGDSLTFFTLKPDNFEYSIVPISDIQKIDVAIQNDTATGAPGAISIALFASRSHYQFASSTDPAKRNQILTFILSLKKRMEGQRNVFGI